MTTNGDSFERLTLTVLLKLVAFVNIVKYLKANERFTCSSVCRTTVSSLLSLSVGPILTDPEPQSPSTENLIRSVDVSILTIFQEGSEFIKFEFDSGQTQKLKKVKIKICNLAYLFLRFGKVLSWS